MKILLLLMVCDSDQMIVNSTIKQVINLLGDLELHFIIYDHASSQRLGEKIKHEFESSLQGKIHVMRSEQSKGYYRLIENFLSMFRYAVQLSERFDYVLRIDPDQAFTSKRFREFFNSERLPTRGVVSTIFPALLRDHLQFYADILPFGFRRRRRADQNEHSWEWAGFRKVWWRNLGIRAFLNGYRGEVTPGSFILIAWETVLAMHEAKYFDLDHRDTGLIFGDDLFIGVMAKALRHPLYDVKDIDPHFEADFFLAEGATFDEIQDKGYYFVHPLKDRPSAHALRREIESSLA
jgi:hypothetical protein